MNSFSPPYHAVEKLFYAAKSTYHAAESLYHATETMYHAVESSYHTVQNLHHGSILSTEFNRWNSILIPTHSDQSSALFSRWKVSIIIYFFIPYGIFMVFCTFTVNQTVFDTIKCIRQKIRWDSPAQLWVSSEQSPQVILNLQIQTSMELYHICSWKIPMSTYFERDMFVVNWKFAFYG